MDHISIAKIKISTLGSLGPRGLIGPDGDGNWNYCPSCFSTSVEVIPTTNWPLASLKVSEYKCLKCNYTSYDPFNKSKFNVIGRMERNKKIDQILEKGI